MFIVHIQFSANGSLLTPFPSADTYCFLKPTKSGPFIETMTQG